ncbi:MAG: hypothetical protein UZ07_CHB004000719 [Chlorobi bacterium OLB7]|nr:hypothetical protein Rctr41k_06 [Virus Rctr41k]KXK57327.1 MAG: hypothetical protein UZ07_CHB004000719 [Chlorobi bacterium OLB7]
MILRIVRGMKLTAKNSAEYLTARNSVRGCVRAPGMRAGLGHVHAVGEGSDWVSGVRFQVSGC